MTRTATTDHPIDEALANRWSPRAFSDRPAEDAVVASLFEAARWSPSASNIQPWSFIHAARGTEDFDRLRGCLNPPNALWAGKAALLVLAIADPAKPDGTPNLHARYDLGQAVAHLTFQAGSLGLHVHQMAGFDPVAARAALNIPRRLEIVSGIAIGYLGEAETLPAALQERERATRTRKPADSFAFRNRWPDAVA
jgi:nitroreductase